MDIETTSAKFAVRAGILDPFSFMDSTIGDPITRLMQGLAFEGYVRRSATSGIASRAYHGLEGALTELADQNPQLEDDIAKLVQELWTVPTVGMGDSIRDTEVVHDFCRRALALVEVSKKETVRV